MRTPKRPALWRWGSLKVWGCLSFTLPLLYLTLTTPRGLMWFDAGELATACATWGIGHPPGSRSTRSQARSLTPLVGSQG